MKAGVVDEIRAAGGEIYAITSEPQRLADDARESWQLTFETLGDPHHEIVDACRERGWLDIIINEKLGLHERGMGSAPRYSHPKGYFQPGVLAIDANARVLYRWRGVPTRKNIGGAIQRPTADHVFECITTARGSDADAELDPNPVLDSRAAPWPLFVALLIANGWFIRPRPFPYVEGGPSAPKRIVRVMIRLALFIGAWACAFAWLPSLWVGAALAAWLLWITPGVRFINEQFQNVPDA
jgi:peroxiredoxin